MLRAILNNSWRQHPTRHQLFGWRSRDELISDVLLWTPRYGRAKAGRPTRTYIRQLCEDTGCSPKDLPEAMNDREKWRKRVRDIRASGMTWWWWWWWWLLCQANFVGVLIVIKLEYNHKLELLIRSKQNFLRRIC